MRRVYDDDDDDDVGRLHGLWLARKRPKLTHFHQRNNINHGFVTCSLLALTEQNTEHRAIGTYSVLSIMPMLCWRYGDFICSPFCFACYLPLCTLMTSKHGMTVYATDSRNMCGDKRKHRNSSQKCDVKRKIKWRRGKNRKKRARGTGRDSDGTSTRTPAMWQNNKHDGASSTVGTNEWIEWKQYAGAWVIISQLYCNENK